MESPRPSHSKEASKKDAAGSGSESAAVEHARVDDDGDSGMTAQLAPQIIISPG
ncbi:MAG: hypothetical protein IPI49_17675 [Myxococcales bacterium]|jgi:hypothetical protein|nr:hypothetical protein [Myxococcales bacterium]HRC54808.1 hypothetical protein [Kofleriaceae bacterium]